MLLCKIFGKNLKRNVILFSKINSQLNFFHIDQIRKYKSYNITQNWFKSDINITNKKTKNEKELVVQVHLNEMW